MIQGFGIKTWQCPTFTWGDPTLSSALSGFTSEFEMGSGGTRTLWLPGKLVLKYNTTFDKFGKIKTKVLVCTTMSFSFHITSKQLGCYMVKPHGQLVLVSFTH